MGFNLAFKGLIHVTNIRTIPHVYVTPVNTTVNAYIHIVSMYDELAAKWRNGEVNRDYVCKILLYAILQKDLAILKIHQQVA